jgi:hypothetical protein
MTLFRIRQYLCTGASMCWGRCPAAPDTLPQVVIGSSSVLSIFGMYGLETSPNNQSILDLLLYQERTERGRVARHPCMDSDLLFCKPFRCKSTPSACRNGDTPAEEDPECCVAELFWHAAGKESGDRVLSEGVDERCHRVVVHHVLCTVAGVGHERACEGVRRLQRSRRLNTNALQPELSCVPYFKLLQVHVDGVGQD